MMRALVTGAGGFLGLYIVEQLHARGNFVRAFCRGDYPRLRELSVAGANGQESAVEIVRGDVRDAAATAAACEGIDCVFHVAALPGIWGDWQRYYETNTLGTRNVLDACLTRGVSRLVYTSSPSVVFSGGDHEGGDESLPYSDRWLCHYPHSKALAEQDVLAANGRRRLATVALRPHLIWGPRDNHLIPRLIQRARTGRLRRVGNGKNRVSVSYVENAAAAHLQAADALSLSSPAAGRAYFINEPEPVNLWQWVEEILGLAGLPPVRRTISAGAARRAGFLCETIYRWLKLPGEPPMTRFLAAQLAGSHWYRIDAAQRDFGYRPLVTMEEGMRRLGTGLQRCS